MEKFQPPSSHRPEGEGALKILKKIGCSGIFLDLWFKKKYTYMTEMDGRSESEADG